MAAAAILNFSNFKFSTVGRLKRAELRRRAKFGRNRSKRGRDMAIFQDGGRRHLGFFKFQILNGRTAEEGRTASPCQIWSKSVKSRPRYGDFSIFQDGGRRHLGLSNFGDFNGPNAEDSHTASPCQILSKSIGQTASKIWRFFDFPIWRRPPSWILKI